MQRREEGLNLLLMRILNTLETWYFPNKSSSWVYRETQSRILSSQWHLSYSLCFYWMKIHSCWWSLVTQRTIACCVWIRVFQCILVQEKIFYYNDLLWSHLRFPLCLRQFWVILFGTPLRCSISLLERLPQYKWALRLIKSLTFS